MTDMECYGCESGCDFDGAHRDLNGNYYPNCATIAAELERHSANICHELENMNNKESEPETTDSIETKI